MAQEDVFKKIVSHCKEYGFVFPSSDIYDGLGAVYDYGQNGVELKNNIKQYWWQAMTRLHENIVGIDSAIFIVGGDQKNRHRKNCFGCFDILSHSHAPLSLNNLLRNVILADNIISQQVGNCKGGYVFCSGQQHLLFCGKA